jgi:hypothetical protein
VNDKLKRDDGSFAQRGHRMSVAGNHFEQENVPD